MDDVMLNKEEAKTNKKETQQEEVEQQNQKLLEDEILSMHADRVAEKEDKKAQAAQRKILFDALWNSSKATSKTALFKAVQGLE